MLRSGFHTNYNYVLNFHLLLDIYTLIGRVMIMGRGRWIVLVIMAVVLVVAFFFDFSNYDKSSVEFASAIQKTSSLPTPITPSCQSLDVTSVFAQRLGLSSKSSSIYQMERLDSRYFAFSFYDYNSSSFKLYLYDLGIDGIFNTTDDNGIFIGQPYSQYVAPALYSTSPNSQDLFCVSNSVASGSVDINRCTLSLQGCTNARVVTTILIVDFKGIVTSSLKNRLYLAYTNYDSSRFNLIYDSCSLQSTSVDSCVRGQNYFINHAKASVFDNYFQRTLPNIGFIHLIKNSTTIASLFNIQLPTPGNVPLPDSININSLSSRAGVQLLGINNFTNSISLVILDSFTGNILVNVDALDQASYSHLIDVTNLGIVIVYRSYKSQSIMEKRVTSSAVIPLYTDQYYVSPRIILPDATVLGYSNSNLIFRSSCTP
mgnify:CR=1 FL=1